MLMTNAEIAAMTDKTITRGGNLKDLESRTVVTTTRRKVIASALALWNLKS